MHLPKAWHVLSPSLKMSWDPLKWNGLRVGWHSWTKNTLDCSAKGFFRCPLALFRWRLEARRFQEALCFISKQTEAFLNLFYVWLLYNHNEHHPNRWLIWACRFQKQLKSWRNNRPPHSAWKAEAVRSNRNECIIANLNTICRRQQAKIIPFVPWFFPFIHSVLQVYSLEVWWSPIMHAVWVNSGCDIYVCRCSFRAWGSVTPGPFLSWFFVFLRCVTPWDLKSCARFILVAWLRPNQINKIVCRFVVRLRCK